MELVNFLKNLGNDRLMSLVDNSGDIFADVEIVPCLRCQREFITKNSSKSFCSKECELNNGQLHKVMEITNV